jgi:hypothetical protein
MTDPPEIRWKPKYKMRNWTESRNINGAVVVVLEALNNLNLNNLSMLFVCR